MWPDEPLDDDGPYHAPSPECPACGGPAPWGARCCGEEECMIYVDSLAMVVLDEPFGDALAAE